ncbi:3-oxoacyl-ACP synthase [Bacillus timonensis]|uniref:3-oxoacyl-ACP synthase n=1 Tax=Bacillus timonensis TaxID=1033734 RepID=UPI0002FFC482|nr:3-oxoacyl-ACP synthase [Bacillus timonensis]
MQSVGILSTGIYIPKEFLTAEDISIKSGIPKEIVETKLGILKKPIPGPDDHTCEMGIKAAREAIKKAKIHPLEIDLIIYIGEEHKEFPLWTAAIKMQQELGAANAWGFDVALRCGTTIMALKVAKDMMRSDDSIKTVLLAGGYRNVDFIDYENPRTRFMYNLGAGGGAILLQRGSHQNHVLESHIITDGAFSEDVVVIAGGTKNPMTKEALDHKLNMLDVLDPEGMKQRLEEKSMQNFLQVIRKAIQKSGYTEADIDYLGILHMKKSAHDYVLNQLGLSIEQSIYLNEYGHIGQMDQILSLELAEKEGKIKEGDLVVLVSAGIGYAWGATVIKWGDC